MLLNSTFESKLTSVALRNPLSPAAYTSWELGYECNVVELDSHDVSLRQSPPPKTVCG